MDIPLDKLGAFPILQLAAAIMIVAFGGVMMWRALVAKSSAQSPTPAAPEQRWYFEGPIAEAFKQMARTNQHLERIGEYLKKSNELAEKRGEQLEDVVRELRDPPARRR